MGKYQEILRMHEQGLSGRSIAASCGCSQNTVAKVISCAKEMDVTYSAEISEAELEALLFPEQYVQRGPTNSRITSPPASCGRSGASFSSGVLLLGSIYVTLSGLFGSFVAIRFASFNYLGT